MQAFQNIMFQFGQRIMLEFAQISINRITSSSDEIYDLLNGYFSSSDPPYDKIFY